MREILSMIGLRYQIDSRFLVGATRFIFFTYKLFYTDFVHFVCALSTLLSTNTYSSCDTSISTLMEWVE